MNLPNTKLTNMDTNEKIDEILVDFYNEVEPDVHEANNNGTVYTKAGTKAKEKLAILIHQAEIKAVNEALQSIENEATSEIGYGGDRRFMEMGMILFKRLHDPEALEKEIVNE